MIKEAHQEARREVHHPLRIRRPDRGRHRHEVVVDKLAGVAVALQVLAQRDLSGIGREQLAGFLVEAQNPAHHAPEAGSQ